MNDHVSEELADYIANYVNELVMSGKTVDKFAIMGAYVAFVDSECQQLLEEIKSARVR